MRIQSDIEIARSANIKPIGDVLAKVKFPMILLHLVLWDVI